MLNYLGLPVAGLDARGRARSDDHARALADARAVRRLGRRSSCSCCSGSAAAPIRRPSYAGAKGKISKGTEVAVAIVEVVLLVFYAIPAWATRVKAFPAESEAVVVRVVAEQFAWNIHYPGPDGRFGRTDIKLITSDNPLGLDRADAAAKDDITTINQLNLPVDRPVLVHLSSKDVIHSFGLFEMRVKQDAIPGMEIPVWFIPNRVGEYEIACSQLCGLGHFRMRGFHHDSEPRPTTTSGSPISRRS